jgi:hypothetical protein
VIALAANFVQQRVVRIDFKIQQGCKLHFIVDNPQFLFQILPGYYPAQFFGLSGTKGKAVISLRQRVYIWLREIATITTCGRMEAMAWKGRAWRIWCRKFRRLLVLASASKTCFERRHRLSKHCYLHVGKIYLFPCSSQGKSKANSALPKAEHARQKISRWGWGNHSHNSLSPRYCSGLTPFGHRNRRSLSSICTSLMLAWRSAM